MKFFHGLLMFFLFYIALAQQGHTMLVVEYDFYLNFESKQHYKSSLYIKDDNQLFLWGNNGRKLVEEEEGETAYDFALTLFESDSIGSYNYTNFSKDTIISRIKWIDKKVYLVQEGLTKIEWEISKETQKVGSILCQKAIGNFRGRSYEVWFAPQFPINAGPWKLNGLPGIILKVGDRTGKIQIVFSEIRKEDPSLFPKIIVEGTNKISIEQFAEFQESLGNDLARKVMAKMPRGAKIEFVNSESMEIFKD